MPLEMQMGLAINKENEQRRRRQSGRKSGSSKTWNQSQTVPFLIQQGYTPPGALHKDNHYGQLKIILSTTAGEHEKCQIIPLFVV